MAEVVQRPTEPGPLPENVYDINGLTYEQLKFIRSCVGDSPTQFELFELLSSVCPDRFEFDYSHGFIKIKE